MRLNKGPTGDLTTTLVQVDNGQRLDSTPAQALKQTRPVGHTEPTIFCMQDAEDLCGECLNGLPRAKKSH